MTKNTSDPKSPVGGELANHPTVKRYLAAPRKEIPSVIDSAWLKQLCMDYGAEDVGFIGLADSPDLGAEREKIIETFPRTKSIISIICRMNRDNVRNPARSLANTEFHSAGEELNHTARKIVMDLEEKGIHAINVTVGFPMEVQKFPGARVWVLSHKTVAVAAGMGRMGINRNVIHEKFGNFILLGSILLEAELTEYSKPIDYNPCLSCKLCVAACPVGAIAPDGHFNFAACFTHNYREFMGGFQDWTDNLADSKNSADFEKRITPGENASMWQSLSYGAQYKAAYCMAVCPAGEDVIGEFLDNRKDFLKEVVKPLQDKKEFIYVAAGSDAEKIVVKRFPNKIAKRAGSGLKAHNLEGFFFGLPLIFQPGRAKDTTAIYHFKFTGADPKVATVTIKNQRVSIVREIVGEADLSINANGKAWIKFLANRSYLPWALLTGQIQLRGNPKLLIKFGEIFVS